MLPYVGENIVHSALKKPSYYIDNLAVQFKQSSRVLTLSRAGVTCFTGHTESSLTTIVHGCTGEPYRMILARCILSLAGYGPWERKAFLTARPAQGKLWEQDWQTRRSAMKRRLYVVTFCCHWPAWKGRFHHPRLSAGLWDNCGFKSMKNKNACVNVCKVCLFNFPICMSQSLISGFPGKVVPVENKLTTTFRTWRTKTWHVISYKTLSSRYTFLVIIFFFCV